MKYLSLFMQLCVTTSSVKISLHKKELYYSAQSSLDCTNCYNDKKRFFYNIWAFLSTMKTPNPQLLKHKCLFLKEASRDLLMRWLSPCDIFVQLRRRLKSFCRSFLTLSRKPSNQKSTYRREWGEEYWAAKTQAVIAFLGAFSRTAAQSGKYIQTLLMVRDIRETWM